VRIISIGKHTWVHYFVEHRDALRSYGIELKKLLGCGEYGCAFEIAGNRVLKVTQSKDEAGTWDVIAEEQRRKPTIMRGIATTYARPFGIALPPRVRKKLLYGIVRECLANVRDTYRTYNGIVPIDGPSLRGDPAPLKELDDMVMFVPETKLMAKSIEHLYLETGGIYFLSDLHTQNVGTRKGEKWFVLRDPGWAWTPTAGMEFDHWQPSHVIPMFE